MDALMDEHRDETQTQTILQPTDLLPFDNDKAQVSGNAAGNVCSGCNQLITDAFVLSMADQTWHQSCLQCHSCQMPLGQFGSCFVKNDQAFCKPCYSNEYGVKCARCGRLIQARDWVRRARQLTYHLACFACDACKRQLSTGEQFALQQCRVLCKQHYMELIDGESAKVSAKQKCKRVRTTFAEEQIAVLQANFQIDSNPDGQDLERIAQNTGLSKRVTQVWFQNSRARQKKYQTIKQRQQAHQPGSSTSNIAPPPPVTSVLTDPEGDMGVYEGLGQGDMMYSESEGHLSSLDMSPESREDFVSLSACAPHFDYMHNKHEC